MRVQGKKNEDDVYCGEGGKLIAERASALEMWLLLEVSVYYVGDEPTTASSMGVA